MNERRFDCPELGFYNMTDAAMVASLQEDAAKGDAYAAACLRARGIKPAGRIPEGVSAKHAEPGPQDAPKNDSPQAEQAAREVPELQIQGHDAEQLRDLTVAIGELSQAMGSPAVFGKHPQSILSQTVRLAAFRLREASAHPAAPQPASASDLTKRLQQKCSDWGTYWREPDSHGVELTVEQATELLQDALRVEVEIGLTVHHLPGTSGDSLEDGIAALIAQPAGAQVAEPVAWISVEDRLPEKFTEVLVAFQDITLPSTGQYTGNHRDGPDGWCYPAENSGTANDGGEPVVTHWMPLPAAPAAPGAAPSVQPAK